MPSLSACLSPLSVPEPSRHFWQAVWMLLTPVVSSRERKHERQRDWASAFHCCAFTVILFYRTLLWQFRSSACVWQWEQKGTSLPAFPFVCLVTGSPPFCTAVSAQPHSWCKSSGLVPWASHDMAEGCEQTSTWQNRQSVLSSESQWLWELPE